MDFKLPEAFLENVKEQLGEEFPQFLESYEIKGRRGIRINSLKTTKEKIKEQAPFHMEPVPWVENGFFIDQEDDPAGHPFYRAGLYYIQEPSAMTPADRLEIKPGEKVLDLCAAPGGKATALAAKLKGEGLLVANDASASRCKALLHNLELFGAGNIVVTNELPQRLEKKFPEYFDKILVDAPCSGEGMFRKEPEVIGSWSPERVEFFAKQQREILSSAIGMLKPGGLLLYSTCTFSKKENEGSISFALEQFPEMDLLEVKGYEGFSKGVPLWGNGEERLSKCVRIWPHKMDGAGHFLALMKKSGEAEREKREKVKKKAKRQEGYNKGFSKEEQSVMDDFLKLLGSNIKKEDLENRGGKVYMMPFEKEIAQGIKFLRCGLYMGELKKKRFEPSQSLALWEGVRNFAHCLNLEVEDPRIESYMRGENLQLTEQEAGTENGFYLVKISGYPLGFGKKVGEILKNKYVLLR